MNGNKPTRAAVEQQRHSIVILNIGGMDRYAQQQAERIDDDMALATRDLLARRSTACGRRTWPKGS